MAKKRSSTKMPRKRKVGGPFLAYAALCEKALTEKDGVHSLIRIFDKATAGFPENLKIPRQGISIRLTLAIGFKSGDFVGTKKLKIDVSDRKLVTRPVELAFEGGEKGPVAIASLEIPIKKSELIWIDVRLDEKLMSRIPLRIDLERSKQVGGSQKAKK